MPKSSVSVVPIGVKKCKPFLLEVMVFSPETGYKFNLMVERSCSPEAEPVWKLVFDLYKMQDGKEVQIVHVSFTAGSADEKKNIQMMVTDGVTSAQARIIVEELHPAAKAIQGKTGVTAAQKKRIRDAASKAVLAVDV